MSDPQQPGALLHPGGARATLAELGEGALVVSEPQPWALLRDAVPAPRGVIEPCGVERDRLEALAERAPRVARIIGIGGGTALDTAKFLAWRSDASLLLIPSILSVDAAFTRTAGVREEGRVRYVGDVEPERIVVDPELVRRAPARLNRAGVGDLLSCHTALHDWALAQEDGHPSGPRVSWDARAADLGRGLLEEIRKGADALGEVSDAGIALLASGFSRVGAACRRVGHARFEEGSEHFLAYAIEATTRRRYVHGELVSFATLILALHQGNSPDEVASVIRRSRVRAHPKELGIERELFLEVAGGLARFVREEDLWWSAVDREPIDRARADHLWREALGRLDAGA